MKTVMVKEREFTQNGIKVLVLRPQRTEDEAAKTNIDIVKKLVKIIVA